MIRGIFCLILGFIFVATSPIYNKPVSSLSGQESGLGLLGIILVVAGLLMMVFASGGKKKKTT